MQTDKARFAKVSVLLVDDCSDTRRIIRQLLRYTGIIKIVEAENGAIAFDQLARESFDLVIADWKMPQMSGFELLDKMKANERFKQIPVLMVTASGTEEAVLQAARRGAADFVVKPFSSDTFLSKVEAIVRTQVS